MGNKNLLNLFLLFICASALQCKIQADSTLQRATDKSIYTDQVKLTYFQQMLMKSFNHSTAIQEVIKADHSGFTEPLLTDADYQLIDSLTTAENEKMIVDSLKGNQRAEGAKGKRPFQFIIKILSSKWLDSLANKRYEQAGEARGKAIEKEY